jgi:hypothetical protein
MSRFVFHWSNKLLTANSKTIDDMIADLQGAADRLRLMKQAGVTLEKNSPIAEDSALLVTTDASVAEKFGFEDASRRSAGRKIRRWYMRPECDIDECETVDEVGFEVADEALGMGVFQLEDGSWWEGHGYHVFEVRPVTNPEFLKELQEWDGKEINWEERQKEAGQSLDLPSRSQQRRRGGH